MLAPNTLIQHRYRIVKIIGQGGMGAVYEAMDERLDNTVALKQFVINASNVDTQTTGLLKRAFEREARILARLHHQSLPKVMDHFSDPEGQFLVMSFFPGPDMADRQKQRDDLFPVSQVLGWADQLLSVLEYLHRHQIVHRDIKPQNMKLTDDGTMVLLDFGLAKGVTKAYTQASTMASIYGYSRHYAPLEQIQDTGTDPRSDLYSLAATLYHLATGMQPVDALSRAAAILSENPDPLVPPHSLNTQISQPVGEVLLHAMALNANHRPPDAAAMRAKLHAASRQGATTGGTVMQTPAADTPDSATSSISPISSPDAATVPALPRVFPFVPLWIIASLLAWVTGWSLVRADLVDDMIDWMGASFISDIAIAGTEVGPVAIHGLLIGALLGAVQWLVLRRSLRRAGWWVLASAVGLAAGLAAGLAVGEAAASEWVIVWVIIGPVAGVILGAVQWLVLRHSLRRAGWWVLASTMALAAGWALQPVLGDAMLEDAFEMAGWSSRRVDDATMDMLRDTATGLVYSLISAPPLVWLLRQQKPLPAVTVSPHILSFSLLWTLASVAGRAAGNAIYVATGWTTGGLWILGGLMAGMLQWLVLRRFLPHAGWWILASAGGLLMGEFMGLIVLETLRWPLPAEWAVYGAVLGTLLGAAQWIVLHHSVPRAGWWVLASAAGLAVAWAASTASGDIIYEAAIEAAGWDSVIDREHMLDVAAGLIYSLITAPLLAWLLRQRRAAPQ